MGIVQALVLGVVQGLSEFLPISSDGHLALSYRLLGTGDPGLGFTVFLHLATLVAMVVYFRSDIVTLSRSLLPAGAGSPERRLVGIIVAATAVSGVLALLLKRVVEAANESLIAIGAGFLLTSAALGLAEVLARRVPARETSGIGWPRALVVAFAQALATLPGVSRSGATIAAGMACGLDRGSAARFSFLLGMPIIAAANLYEAKDILTGAAGMPSAMPLIAGFVAAGVTGYAAIWVLLRFVRTRPLYWFAGYTALVGTLTIAWGAGLLL